MRFFFLLPMLRLGAFSPLSAPVVKSPADRRD